MRIFQYISIILLLLVIGFIGIVTFNPFELRSKMISSFVNSYLTKSIEKQEQEEKSSATTTKSDELVAPATSSTKKLLSEDQIKSLETLGIDVDKLPTEISPGMEKCMIDALGEERAKELAGGETPGVLDVLRAKKCLFE